MPCTWVNVAGVAGVAGAAAAVTVCASGLTAQIVTPSLRPWMRTHYVQPNVGHYGVFSGKRWQNHNFPVVRDVIHVSQ